MMSLLLRCWHLSKNLEGWGRLWRYLERLSKYKEPLNPRPWVGSGPGMFKDHPGDQCVGRGGRVIKKESPKAWAHSGVHRTGLQRGLQASTRTSTFTLRGVGKQWVWVGKWHGQSWGWHCWLKNRLWRAAVDVGRPVRKLASVQVKDDGGSDQWSDGGGDWKWPNLG